MEKTTKNATKAAQSSRTSSNDLNTTVSQANNFLEDLFLHKAPAIPVNVKEAIVKYGPYATLIVLLFSLPGLLFLIGIGSLFAPLPFMAVSPPVLIFLSRLSFLLQPLSSKRSLSQAF